MTAIPYGLGASTSYGGQTFPSTSPLGSYAFGPHPFASMQPQQLLQQLLQIVPQQLQQLLHIVPQQLNQLQNVQQQQAQHLQQLLQIVPQQLHQLQQLVQSVSHHLTQQPFVGAPQPFGTIQPPNVGAFGAGLSQQAAGPWGLTAAGQGVQPLGHLQTAGIVPQNFGFGAQPGQLM